MVIQPDSTVGSLPEVDGIAVTTRDDGTIAVSYRARQTSAEDVLSMLRDNGVRIRDVRTEQADLEDVFLSLTRSA